MLLWFMAILPGGAVANRNDPPCGRQPHDADQVASVRGTAADQCDCHRAYRHSEYVSCVTEVAYAAVAYGSLRPECSGALVYCAALSETTTTTTMKASPMGAFLDGPRAPW